MPRPVNKIIYILLVLFLGTFGVHKFYAGKTGMGFIYLVLALTTGLTVFLAFFDLIVAICKPADYNGDIYF